MGQELFEELLEGVREAGAALCGKREAARLTVIGDSADGEYEGHGQPGEGSADADP